MEWQTQNKPEYMYLERPKGNFSFLTSVKFSSKAEVKVYNQTRGATSFLLEESCEAGELCNST